VLGCVVRARGACMHSSGSRVDVAQSRRARESSRGGYGGRHLTSGGRGALSLLISPLSANTTQPKFEFRHSTHSQISVDYRKGAGGRLSILVCDRAKLVFRVIRFTVNIAPARSTPYFFQFEKSGRVSV
jgi:hypothetical protein